MNKKVYILLHDIRSVHNVGSIFRTADAAGVTKIILSGTSPTPLDRFGRKRADMAKVALGAENTVPWEYIDDVYDFLKNTDLEIVAVEQHSTSLDFKKFIYTKPTLFVFGNEVDGVDKKILELSNKILEIPMAGKKESLNVSVTVGIILFSITRPQK